MNGKTGWLTSLLGETWRRRLVPVAVAGLLGAVIAIVAASFIQRVYRVEVVLAPNMDSLPQGGGLGALLGGVGGLAAMAGLPLNAGGQKNEAIAILRSKTFTQSFIGQRNLLPVLFASKWNPQTKAWKVTGSEIPTLADGYRVIERDIRKVGDNKVTGLVTLTIDWHDRDQAAEWANSMVRQLNDEMRQRAIEDAKRSLTFLDTQLKTEQVVGLQQAIYRLVETQMNREMLAQVREEYAFRVVDPAVVPDAKDAIWPRRRVLAPLGLVLGMILGAFWALIAERMIRRNG